jgi:G:T-mismatch repair DNA endonuclease (very short patch repair protein)
MLCLECGCEVRNINFSHLKSCSGLTPQEYLAKHPGAELVDPDVKKSYGLPLEKNPKWRGGRSYRYCNSCEKRLSRRNRSNLCQSCARKGEKNPFFGKKHDSETRARLVQSAKYRDRATYFPKKPSPENLSRARRNYWSNIPQSERASRLSSFIEAGQRHNKKSSKTEIENIMADLLSEQGVAYERNVQIGRYNVDFLVERTAIIECFGDYWHCNPQLYAPDFYHRSLHINAEEKWHRDSKRRQLLEELGYVFHSVWEYDIDNHLDKVKQQIKLLFNTGTKI